MAKDRKVIGSTIIISIPASGIYDLPAKVDTGADGSAIWASDIKESNGTLQFCLLGPTSKKYTAKVIKTKDFTTVKVKNSFGQSETRYKVTLGVVVEGRRVRARFSLANRKVKSYSALVGKRLLNNRFIVDVSKSN